MILSTLTTTPLEEVRRVGGNVWFQLYVYKDLEVNRELLQKAEASGCQALVVTVDPPAWGLRESDLRNRFFAPEVHRHGNPVYTCDQDGKGGLGVSAYTERGFKADITWKDIEWLQARTKLPVVLKGILHPEDAELAAGMGIPAIMVSNHDAGRLVITPEPHEVLARIAEAVDGLTELILDGGVRRGGDVLTAIALGARAAAVGRPVLWGLAVDGERGVDRVLGLLRSELEGAMALCGCSAIDQISADLIYPEGS